MVKPGSKALNATLIYDDLDSSEVENICDEAYERKHSLIQPLYILNTVSRRYSIKPC